jgi:hypothetical protein
MPAALWQYAEMIFANVPFGNGATILQRADIRLIATAGVRWYARDAAFRVKQGVR